MAPVFAHGRLRLYLLKLLDESPCHGYEVIRLLEERFQGLYAPSAGTVYPRLAKLEKEGLVTHSTEGGRKVYALTDAGRAELTVRQGELEDLEQEIRDSVRELAAEIRQDVRGSAGDLRREFREAARQARSTPGAAGDVPGADFRRMKQKWNEQARRAKEEARSAREQAREVQQFAHDEVTSATSATSAEEHDEYGHLPPSDTPARDPERLLERLLDMFRDDVRDAARDHGVDAGQLREARRHLSMAAAHIGAVLRRPKG